jgi:hypothetical protein
MRKLKWFIAPLFGTFALALTSVQAGVLLSVPNYPGAIATYIRAINDKNVVTGYYTSSDGNSHGFVGTLDGNYTSFDASANGTMPLGIDNAGYITISTNYAADCPISGCAYIRAPGGAISEIHKGKHVLDSVVQGILNKDRFVGDYALDGEAPNVNPTFHGYYGRGDRYRASITLPFTTTQTRPRGINRAGTIVGFYSEIGNGTFPGFVLQDGVATTVAYPDDNAWQVYLESINDKGMVAGSWVDYALTMENAFLFDTTQNTFAAITVPRGKYVLANSINNKGVIAISTEKSSYIYCLKKSACPAAGRKAVEESTVWRAALPGNIRSMLCRDRCLRPNPH